MADFGEVGSASVAIRADFEKFRDDLGKAGAETRTATTRMGRAFEGLRNSVAKLGISIGGVGAALRTATVAGAAAAAGFLALTRRALNVAEGIGDMAARAGTSAEALQELRFAANQNGAEFNDMDMALVKLGQNLSLFATDGSGSGKLAFEGMGIAARDTAGNLRDTGDVFVEIAGKISGMEDSAKAAAFASSAFGEDVGAKLVPLLRQGEAGVEAFRERARELGLVLSEDVVNGAAEASAKLRSLEQLISTQFTNAFAQAAPQVTELVDAFVKRLPEIIEFIARVSEAIGLIEETASMKIASKKRELEDLREEMAAMESGEIFAPWTPFAYRNEERAAALEAEIEALEAQRREITDRLNSSTPAAPGAGAYTGGGGSSGKTDKDPDEDFRRAEERLIDMTAALENQRAALGMTTQEAEEFRAELEAYGIVLDRNLTLTEPQAEKLHTLAEAHIDAASALNREREAQEALEESQRQSADALRDLTDAMLSGEEAGKRLLEVVAKLVAQGLFMGEGPFAGLQDSAGGALGSLFSGLFTKSAKGNVFGPSGLVTAFAKGGVVNAPTFFPHRGGTGLMGEAGEEGILPLKRGADGRLGVSAFGGGSLGTLRVALDAGLIAEMRRASADDAGRIAVEITDNALSGPKLQRALNEAIDRGR